MARIFISGSSTGLDLLAGKRLIGNEVMLHARNRQRAADIEASGAAVCALRSSATLSTQVGSQRAWEVMEPQTIWGKALQPRFPPRRQRRKAGRVIGQYLHHLQVREPDRRTRDPQIQERLLALCSKLSGLHMNTIKASTYYTHRVPHRALLPASRLGNSRRPVNIEGSGHATP